MNEGDALPAEWISSAAKMEALSRFHAGISHDLNNRLTTLTGYLSILGDLLPGEEEMLEEMRHAAAESAELVRLIQTFRKRDPLPLSPLELGRFFQRLQDLLGRLFDQNRPLPCLLPDEDVYILGEEGALEQILLSLLAASLSAPPPTVRVEAENDLVRIELAGLPPAVPAPATQELIRCLDGRLLDTAQGRTLLFPRLYPGPLPPLEPPETASGETLLLAERDPHVRAFLQERLRQGGYQVHTADDVQTCSRLCAAQTFGFAVLDTRLSGGGLDALHDLPGLPSRRVWMEPFAEADRIQEPRIAKPFRPVELLRLLSGF